MEKMRFSISSSPHIRQSQTVQSIMRDVVIALIPTAIYGVIQFGYQAALVMLSGVAGAVLTEFVGNKLTGRPVTVTDFSAIITGLLLAMCCPAYVPLWVPFIGSVFAIAIGKLPFGGLGQNFLNPALVGRAFLLASWPALMTHWTPADAVSAATPLAAYKATGAMASYGDLFFGNIPGCIGEVSKLCILIGAAYLLLRHVITLATPLGYLGGLALMIFAFGGQDGLFTGDALFAILSGGAMFGAFFMCTDYVTIPVTQKGQFIMGLGAGILTALIRTFGGYAEGVTYAILFMNVVTPLIDRFVHPKLYGEAKKHA